MVKRKDIIHYLPKTIIHYLPKTNEEVQILAKERSKKTPWGKYLRFVHEQGQQLLQFQKDQYAERDKASVQYEKEIEQKRNICSLKKK